MEEINIIESKTFKRLQEYKVDFAYSKNQYYSAINRLNQEEQCYIKIKKHIDITILIFTLLSFSSAIYSRVNLIILGIFAFIAFGLSVYQFINSKDFSRNKDYKKAADKYLTLHKDCKNIITKAEDNLISIQNLSIEIDNLQLRQNELMENSPKTEYSDYLEAKKQIEEGSFEYTTDEIERT